MYKHGGDIYNNKDKIDFSTNTNLLGIPESILRAAYKGVDLSEHYPDPQCQELRKEISRKEQFPINKIICGNGAAELIFSLAFCLKPQKALLVTPSFYEYEKALSAADCAITYYAAKEENGFELQEDFLLSVTEELDIIFLCNPNNPTGTLIAAEFLEKILKRCEEYHILFVMDECFMDFVEDEDTYTVKPYCQQSENLFILKAFTKLYAMPGLRLGYGLCNNEKLLEQMRNITQPWSISLPAQLAGIAALKENEYVKKSLEILKEEKQYLVSNLTGLGAKVYASGANYIFFRVLDKCGNEKTDLYQECLKRGFLIRDCSNYKGLEKGYYRITVKSGGENQRLMAALREVL